MKNIILIIACFFISDTLFSQSRFKRTSKINLKKEVKSIEKDGFQYERRVGFETALQRMTELGEELEDNGAYTNILGTGTESSFDQTSAKENASLAAGIDIATQISQQINQVIERDIVDPGTKNVLKETVNLASAGTSQKLQRNNVLVLYKKNKDNSFTYEVTAYHNIADAMELFNKQMAYELNKVKAVEARKKYDDLLGKGLNDEVNDNIN